MFYIIITWLLYIISLVWLFGYSLSIPENHYMHPRSNDDKVILSIFLFMLCLVWPITLFVIANLLFVFGIIYVINNVEKDK